MTDSILADPKRAGDLAQKIVVLLSDEDSGTRRRAIQAALMLLGDTPLGDEVTQHHSKQAERDSNESVDLGEFFVRSEKMKPAENAQLCVAYHYAMYGAIPFSIEDIRNIGAEAGVVLPNRLDMTLNVAADGGKKLFQVVGKGTFKVTAAAGIIFKDRWGVRPGKTVKAS